jgi:DNA-binding PadR family transcriptional regulator
MVTGMYRDKSLLPTQAIRLAVLGSLGRGDRRYAELATETRHFTGAIVGPSLDLLGTSIELLRFEGLIAPTDGGQGMADNAVMRLTDGGRDALHDLLIAPLRAPLNDIGRLILALKLRFLDLLPAADQAQQTDLMTELAESEVARLTDLVGRTAGEPGQLGSWLDLELAQARARLAWFEALRATRTAPSHVEA